MLHFAYLRLRRVLLENNSMILSDEELKERLESPLNLLNRLRNATTLKPSIPCLPPSSKDLGLDNKIDESVAVGKLRETAAGIMALSMEHLKDKIPEIQKAETLARIAGEMNKVVQSRQDDEKKVAQIIVYAPTVMQENNRFQELILTDEQ
jgi:hypothetical protein